MRLLDTDTASHVLQGRVDVVGRLQTVGDPAIYTTVITRIELLRGRIDFLLKATADQLLHAQEFLETTLAFLDRVRIIPLNKPAVQISEKLLKIKGLKKIGRADLLIASIALA